MTPKQFAARIKQKQSQIVDLVRRILPVKIGALAQNHFRNNFRNGGFDDMPWPITKRQQKGGKNAVSQYGPLTSSRNHLMNNVRYIAGDGKTTIENRLIYAEIHNEGGTVKPKISKKMRAMAWAKYFEETGIQKGMSKEDREAAEEGASEEAKMWKNLALTKKTELSIKIPKRQYIGPSKPLDEKVMAKIKEEIDKILK